MGVNLFSGKFYKCVDANGTKLYPNVSPHYINYKNDCLAQNLTWKNSDITFDNVFDGYLALLQVVSAKKRE